MDLPESLQTGLTEALHSFPPGRLARVVEDLSGRYRAGHGGSQGSFLRSREDVVAYAAYRLPATFAAIAAALLQLRNRRPAWRPRSLLDVGAGPGTAMWAAQAVWPGLERVTLLEREEGMIELGRRLASRSASPAVRAAEWRLADVTRDWNVELHDLVIAAYLLGEAPASGRADLIDRLWRNSADTVVLLEPGTPAGYSLVLAGRDQLICAGGHTVAPCPHDLPCPLAGHDWCHFAQRMARTPLHREAKRGRLSYEDEKFSYAAMSRTPGSPIEARVIRHPKIRSGHIYLDLCTLQGIERRIVTRKDRSAFRQARDLRWGSAISAEDASAP